MLEVSDPEPRFVVIDSNLVRSGSSYACRALDFLRERGATSVHTVVLTHMHQDHYSGLELILKSFDVERLVIPPMFSANDAVCRRQLDKAKKKLQRQVSLTDDDAIVKPALSLAAILKFIRQNKDKVEEATGRNNVFQIPGASNLELRAHLPLKGIKGQIHAWFENGSAYDNFPHLNDSSIALSVRYRGHNLLLTGDSTRSQWEEHRRLSKRDGVVCLEADLLKAPHHGSKDNNNDSVYDYLLNPEKRCHVFVSSNGRSHPHDEFFALVAARKIQPHCTNLAIQCTAPNVERFPPMSGIPAAARAFIEHYDVDSAPIPCQGDITLRIDDQGDLTIANSTNRPCIYS